MKKNSFQLISVVLVNWTFGFIIGFFVFIMTCFGLIRTENLDKRKLRKSMAESGKGVIIVVNHLSWWETVVIPALFFPEFLFSWKLMPVSTPKDSLYNAWWFFIRPVCVSVVRNDAEAGFSFMRKVSRMLKEGRIVILFAEGGRTPKGKPDDLKWRGDKRIRRFKEGVAGLMKLGNPIILPVWAEKPDGGAPLVRFGQPVAYNGETVSAIEDMVLELSGARF